MVFRRALRLSSSSARRCGSAGCSGRGDEQTIDRFGPHGAAYAVGIGNRVTARLQSGYLYSYALVMLLGLIAAAAGPFWWAAMIGLADADHPDRRAAARRRSCLFVGANAARWIALVATLVDLAIGIGLWAAFDPDGAQWQFVEHVALGGGISLGARHRRHRADADHAHACS